MTKYPETMTERKERLVPFILRGDSTCPTSDGIDLEVWERLKQVVQMKVQE